MRHPAWWYAALDRALDCFSWWRDHLAVSNARVVSPGFRRRPQLEWLETRLTPATFIVTTTTDNDAAPQAGSLRKAIDDANKNAGPDVIEFDIGPGKQTIQIGPLLAKELPNIIDPVTIDATETHGHTGQTIELDGSLLGAGKAGLFFIFGTVNRGGTDVDVTSSGSKVYGLTIRKFDGQAVLIQDTTEVQIGGTGAKEGNTIIENGIGVKIYGTDATGNEVIGNFIGTDRDSDPTLGNTKDGVLIAGGATGNVVGGTTSAHRNIISKNGHNGVAIYSSSSNTVTGNYIGSDVDGICSLGNGRAGVMVFAGTNKTAAMNTISKNVISGNTQHGVFVSGDGGATGTKIFNNFIGTTAAGSAALPNLRDGILIDNGKDFEIGGTVAGTANVISGNTGDGIFVKDTVATSATSQWIKGNYIGVAANGTSALGNGGHGVDFTTTSEGTRVGGTADAAKNLIKNNGGAGVKDPGGKNPSQQKSTGLNGGLGIDIGAAGVTTTGMPVVAAAVAVGGNTFVRGSLTSTANTTFVLDFFGNDVADPSGYGEGENYLGSISLTTDASGYAEYNASFAGSGGNFVTATSTDEDAGWTSEFSAVTAVTSVTYGTTTSLSASSYSVVPKQPVTLTASVSGTWGVALTGSVTFYRGSVALGTAPVTSGGMMGGNQAVLTTSFPAAWIGSNSITAVYGGDSLNRGSVSSPVTINVQKGTVIVMASSDAYPPQVNVPLTIKASVGGGIWALPPTGTVSFYIDSVLLAEVALSAGTFGSSDASVGYTFTTSGSHTVTAVYSGDDSFLDNYTSPTWTVY